MFHEFVTPKRVSALLGNFKVLSVVAAGLHAWTLFNPVNPFTTECRTLLDLREQYVNQTQLIMLNQCGPPPNCHSVHEHRPATRLVSSP